MEDDKVIKYMGLINAGQGKGIQIEDVYKAVGIPFDTYMLIVSYLVPLNNPFHIIVVMYHIASNLFQMIFYL